MILPLSSSAASDKKFSHFVFTFLYWKTTLTIYIEKSWNHVLSRLQITSDNCISVFIMQSYLQQFAYNTNTLLQKRPPITFAFWFK